MKKIILIIVVMPMLCVIPVESQQFIADFSVAKETVLRSIPAEYINKARNELLVAYQHTSHGTHVSRGVFGLPDFKIGDEQLFGISNSDENGKLHFMDYALASYAPSGVDGSDLSRDETAFIQTTRNFLDAPENASVNVVMWSWCNIAGHNVSDNYLPGMTTLISEYGQVGSKIGTGDGQRELPVAFIFMTGHANVNANTGDSNPKNQAALIKDYCNSKGQFCLDYYSIDTHDMDDTYFEDSGDDGNSASYGGNFYTSWQNSHALGEDYFENKETPGGSVAFGAHNSQHITANRKAYAFWWIIARIAGWEGHVVSAESRRDHEISLYPNPARGLVFLNTGGLKTDMIEVFNLSGQKIKEFLSGGEASEISLDLTGMPDGCYLLKVHSEQGILYRKLILQ